MEHRYGSCFGWQQLLANSTENFISHKKKRLVAVQNLQIIKTLLTLKISWYCKRGSMFSSSKPVAACSNCSRLANTLCLCLPIQTAQAVLACCLKRSTFDFAVKTLDCLLFSGFDNPHTLTLAKLHLFIPKSFLKSNKASTNFNEALTKPYHDL